MLTPKMSRAWAMPSAHTFTIKPISEFVHRWLAGLNEVVDPFAGESSPGKYTNDLNPSKPTTHHLEAVDFLALLASNGITAEAVLLDPPYSPRQITECYRGFGRKATTEDTNKTHWKPERDAADKILRRGGVVLSFGWNSSGMGIKRGYSLEEVLLVCHGGGHNDTICLAERKC
jgi:hypothetical protein